MLDKTMSVEQLGLGEAVLRLGLCHGAFFGEEERGVPGKSLRPRTQTDF